jgi:hypothetical protein
MLVTWCALKQIRAAIVLNRVLPLPLLRNMLLSVPAITNSGKEVRLTKDKVEFRQGVELVAKRKRRGRIYELALDIYATACLLSKTKNSI